MQNEQFQGSLALMLMIKCGPVMRGGGIYRMPWYFVAKDGPSAQVFNA